MSQHAIRVIEEDELGRNVKRYVFAECKQCGARFWKKMPWARFCSTKCRVYYKRRPFSNASPANWPLS